VGSANERDRNSPKERDGETRVAGEQVASNLLRCATLRPLPPPLPTSLPLPTLSFCSLCSQLLFACYLVPPLHPTQQQQQQQQQRISVRIALRYCFFCFYLAFGQQPTATSTAAAAAARGSTVLTYFFCSFCSCLRVLLLLLLLCFMLYPMRCYMLYMLNPSKTDDPQSTIRNV